VRDWILHGDEALVVDHLLVMIISYKPLQPRAGYRLLVIAFFAFYKLLNLDTRLCI